LYDKFQTALAMTTLAVGSTFDRWGFRGSELIVPCPVTRSPFSSLLAEKPPSEEGAHREQGTGQIFKGLAFIFSLI
jgi:hypothetical protein